MTKRVKYSAENLPGPSSRRDSEQESDGVTYFESVPVEVLLEIFKWLPMEDTVKMMRESSLLNDAIRLHLKFAMLGLRRNCAQALLCVKDKLLESPLNRERLGLESIGVLRYISKEIEVLFASVWRLRDDHEAWTELAPHLAPVIREFDDTISSRYVFGLYHVLDGYWVRNVLEQWHLFLGKVDSGLEQRLYDMASRKTPFEIRVIDLLMCAPSFNFQLALKRLVTGGAYYNVYGFFKTPNLKAICQVPNVFNVELNIDDKKKTLSSYLRETVQQENMRFLNYLCRRIHDLEMEFSILTPHPQHTVGLFNQLLEGYRLIQESPYPEVMKKSRYHAAKELYEEYYVRCSDQNMNLTGLHCVVVVPMQEVWNLPLVVPFLRGRRQKLVDHLETVEMEGSADLSNLFPPFANQDHSPDDVAEIVGSEKKPRMQLVIHYRESYVAGPSEIIIDVGYDDSDTCYLKFHNLVGELLVPRSPSP